MYNRWRSLSLPPPVRYNIIDAFYCAIELPKIFLGNAVRQPRRVIMVQMGVNVGGYDLMADNFPMDAFHTCSAMAIINLELIATGQ
jgi:hypothetical protein